MRRWRKRRAFGCWRRRRYRFGDHERRGRLRHRRIPRTRRNGRSSRRRNDPGRTWAGRHRRQMRHSVPLLPRCKGRAGRDRMELSQHRFSLLTATHLGPPEGLGGAFLFGLTEPATAVRAVGASHGTSSRSSTLRSRGAREAQRNPFPFQRPSAGNHEAATRPVCTASGGQEGCAKQQRHSEPPTVVFDCPAHSISPVACTATRGLQSLLLG